MASIGALLIVMAWIGLIAYRNSDTMILEMTVAILAYQVAMCAEYIECMERTLGIMVQHYTIDKYWQTTTSIRT
jgi:hypothetical protein